MTAGRQQFDELRDILWSIEDGSVADGNIARLDELVRGDELLLRQYIEYARLVSDLRFGATNQRTRETLARAIGLDAGTGGWELGAGDGRREADNEGFGDLEICRFGDFGIGDSGFGVRDFQVPNLQISKSPNQQIPSLSPLPSPLSPLTVGGPVFSYIAATLILGVMLLSAWAYKISHDYNSSLVANSRRSTTSGGIANQPSAFVVVGRVTGIKDCRWADPATETYAGAAVPLGRKYALSSGLMEITYRSGARVILEGPCRYEVEAPAGGFLALGKLTARVEESGVRGQGSEDKKGDRGEGRGERGMKADSLATSRQPLATNLSPHSPLPTPLFAVRTPTAVVTDLGTEFGVEVDDLGNTESHVFQGMVKLRMIGGSGQSEQAITIGVGQSVRCGRGEEKLVFVAERLPDRFVRRIEFNQTNKRIVETFDGDELNPAFEQIPLGKYINVNGTAVYHQTNVGHQSRGYIRTVSSNFCDRDFIFEATIRVEVNAPSRTPGSIHHVFFGIGDAVPKTDHYDTVSNGLVLDFVIDEGRAYVRLCHPITRIGISWDRNLDEFVPAGGFASGRHRFRMWKTGQRVGFEVEANLDQPTQKKYSSRPINLSLDIPPLLDASNSHLLIGTGNCDTVTVSFEDLSISYSQTPEERTAEKATKSRLPAAKSTQT